MIVLFVLAQAADLATWIALRPSEANPLVVAAGPLAVVAKVALGAYVVALAAVIGHRPLIRFVLALGIAVGVVGAWSNAV